MEADVGPELLPALPLRLPSGDSEAVHPPLLVPDHRQPLDPHGSVQEHTGPALHRATVPGDGSLREHDLDARGDQAMPKVDLDLFEQRLGHSHHLLWARPGLWPHLAGRLVWEQSLWKRA